jgi:flagellar basal-body rod protein FlgB
MKTLFRSHIDITAKVLDLRLQRQNVVMANIANIQTPNYKPRRLEFEEEIQKALDIDQHGRVSRTDDGHMPTAFDAKTFEGDGKKEFQPRYVYGEDTVDMDKEMAIMSKNQMLYDALATIMKGNFSGMKKIIQDGSK